MKIEDRHIPASYDGLDRFALRIGIMPSIGWTPGDKLALMINMALTIANAAVVIGMAVYISLHHPGR